MDLARRVASPDRLERHLRAIADRTRAAANWSDLSSAEWAAQLMAAWWHELDWTYLASLPDNLDPDYAAALGRAREWALPVIAGEGPSPV